MNEKLAHELVEAIRMFNEKPENLEIFESYLSHHFDEWFTDFVNSPASLVYEIKQFAEMED